MMSSDLHDVFSDGRRRRTARWLVVAGFGVWVAGLALWELTWVGSLAASLAGGAALTYGLSRVAQGSGGTGSPVWAVTVPVAISLVLISQGVGQAEFAVRVALVGLGTLGMVVVFLRVLDERLTVERQLAQRTLADERRRLAGDVHDLVGHTLSASMLHTTAARLAVRSDPDAAIASLERAEQQGRRSMNDIRSVVRLLRDDPGTVPTAPRASELPQLIEAFVSAGADITFRSTGDLDDLPAPSALTVYRVVQEGLTNAVRHGTGGVDVTVDHLGDCVDVEISNDRAQPSAVATPGNGLIGMRERINAIDGTLEVGATGTGHRWVLHARIPA
jgi:signal transduction histidine kinase